MYIFVCVYVCALTGNTKVFMVPDSLAIGPLRRVSRCLRVQLTELRQNGLGFSA